MKMRMKMVFITLIAGAFIFAAERSSRGETSSPDNAKIAELAKEYKTHLSALRDLRAKLISENEDLKNLHEQIIELHSKLASELEKNPEIKAMNDKIIAVEEEMRKLRAENKVSGK